MSQRGKEDLAAENDAQAGDAEKEIQALKTAMAKMQVDRERAMEDLLRRFEQAATQKTQPVQPVNIQVQAPPPLPRLRVFTGLPPTSQQEASFEDWRAQAKVVMNDSAIQDAVQYLQRSLRGVALMQCETLKPKSAQALIDHFDKLFGVVKSPDDMFLDLYSIRQGRHQTVADLLTSICGRLQTIRERASLKNEEFDRRLYLILMRACSSDSLSRELRGHFGIPGEAHPTYEDLLHYIRRIEELDGPRSRPKPETAVTSSVHLANSPGAMEMAAIGSASTGAQNRHLEAKRRTKYCFKCGLPGHFYANCGNPDNVDLVARRERENRRRTNEWRQKKGLSPLPLN